MRNQSAEQLSVQSQSDADLDRYYKEKIPDVLGALKRTARQGCGKKLIKKRFPVLGWLPHYKPRYLIQDFIAGLTVGLTAIPQGIAYAVVAGLTPEYGLYSDFMASFIYIIFGTCKDITIGPTALMALMVQTYTPISPDFAILSTFLTGCIITIFGLLNLGFLVQFISTPVTAGFTTAAAITIGCGQINSLFGIASKSNKFVDSWENFFTKINETRPWDATLGITTLVFLLLLRKLRDLKGPLKGFGKYISLSRNAIAVIIGTLIAYLCESNGSHPFKLTGKMKSGLPPFKPPPFSTDIKNGTEHLDFTDMISTLGTSVISIPIISILESVAISKAFSRGKTVDATQEMVALGICNVFGSFVSSMPVTGSFTRTVVNNASGVRTTLGGIVTGVLVLLALGLLTETFYYIPKATLSAIIIGAMIFMVHFEKPVMIWKTKKIDIIPYAVTVLICLFVELEIGIICGIATSVIFILYETSRPQIVFKNEKLLGYEILSITPNQSLVFSSAEHLKYRIIKNVSAMSTDNKFVVINGELVHTIDTTVALNLLSMLEDLKILNCDVIFWNWRKETAGIAWRLSKDLGKHFQTGTNINDAVRSRIEVKPFAISATEQLP